MIGSTIDRLINWLNYGSNDIMRKPLLRLYRVVDTLDETGCFGVLIDDNGTKICNTVELNWRQNRRNESCIPAGMYEVAPNDSPTFGRTFVVKDVPGRSNILFHAGNWAGNKAKGMISDTDGCILPGIDVRAILQPNSNILQLGVTQSRVAMDRLLDRYLGGFNLKIEG